MKIENKKYFFKTKNNSHKIVIYVYTIDFFTHYKMIKFSKNCFKINDSLINEEMFERIKEECVECTENEFDEF